MTWWLMITKWNWVIYSKIYIETLFICQNEFEYQIGICLGIELNPKKNKKLKPNGRKHNKIDKYVMWIPWINKNIIP